MARHNEIGKLGEDIAIKFLLSEGFSLIERNYLKKFGEIDIVAKNKGVFHFVEVKTVSCENLQGVNHETRDVFRPEDNIHAHKIKRLSRTIEAYLIEKHISDTWQFDVVTVYVDTVKKEAKVNFLPNVVL